MEKKLPIPPFTLETAKQKYKWQKMHGIHKILKSIISLYSRQRVEKQTFVYKRPKRDCTVPYSEMGK